MILDIDAGNSWIKWRLHENAEIVQRGSQATASALDTGLELPKIKSLSAARLSSVANHSLTQQLYRQCLGEYSVKLQVARVSAQVGQVTCGYEQPEKLGVDRWLAVLAAYDKYSQSVLVVDAGSALTLDLVGLEGQHLGGYILPGKKLMREALWQGTNGVKVEAEDVHNLMVPGVVTEEAVNRGCLLAAIGLIQKLAAQYPASIVVTGGDAKMLIDGLGLQAFHCPDLVLEGLCVSGVEFSSVAPD